MAEPSFSISTTERMTTGIIIAVAACAIAIIGIVRDNKAAQPKGLLRLNRIGLILLFLSGISLLAAIGELILTEREKVKSQREARKHEQALQQQLSELMRQGQELNERLKMLLPEAPVGISRELRELSGLAEALFGKGPPVVEPPQRTPEWVPIHPRATPEERKTRTDERGNISGSFAFSIALFEQIGIAEWYEKELTRTGFKVERGNGTLLLNAYFEPEGSGMRRSISLNMHSAFKLTVSWEERKQ